MGFIQNATGAFVNEQYIIGIFNGFAIKKVVS